MTMKRFQNGVSTKKMLLNDAMTT
jgi:hypothetical protein